MIAHTALPSRIDARNTALVAAENRRTAAVHEADVEYGETVAKLRERFEADLADALSQRIAAVRPAYLAYNAQVIAAEQAFRADQRRCLDTEELR